MSRTNNYRYIPDKARNKFQNSPKSAVLDVCRVICVAVQLLMFDFSWTYIQTGYFMLAKTSLTLLLVYGSFLFCFHNIYSGLSIGSNRVSDLFIAQFLALAISNTLSIPVMMLVLKQLPNLWIILLLTVSQSVFSLLWCIAANQLYHKLFQAAKTAVVYDSDPARESVASIYLNDHRFCIAKTLNLNLYKDNLQELFSELKDMDAVFLCAVSSHLRNDLLKFCVEHGICTYVRPKIGDVLIGSARRKYISHVPVLVCDISSRPFFYRIAKRTADIFFSGLMLIAASPVFLAVAIAIRLEDHGPVFYKQKRLTQYGKEFSIIKFRSMRVDAEKDGVARLACNGDSRITRVGSFIRSTRLDELPQLINVLRGDMTLVGPRPERPEISEQYAETFPEFHMRLQVKAGLTGYAQIHGKYNTTPYDKLQMDLMYIADMSLALDLKLILQTIQIMLRKESTEGIGENQTTAARSGELHNKSA